MSFDHLAPFYRGLERVLAGPLLQRCRVAHLGALPPPRNALLAGEGPGRFLAALLRAHPGADVTCVESSAGMVAAARRHLASLGLDPRRVRFEACDALGWEPPRAEFDLVATHFFLDCFRPDQLGSLVPRLAAAAAPGAAWLVSDFRVPDRGWRRARALAIHRAMYLAFRIATRLPARSLTPPDAWLSAAGFRLESRRVSNAGLLHSDLWRKPSPGTRT